MTYIICITQTKMTSLAFCMNSLVIFFKIATTEGHQSISSRLLKDHAPGKPIRVLITSHFWKGVAQAVMANVQAWVSMLILLKREEASTCKQPRRILFVVRCNPSVTTQLCRHVFNAPCLSFYISWSQFLFTVEKNAKEKEKNITETFDYRHWSQFKLLKLPKYYPRDSILVLSEIRSTADRLISDSVLNLNNWNRYKWCFAFSPRLWKAFLVHRLTWTVSTWNLL